MIALHENGNMGACEAHRHTNRDMLYNRDVRVLHHAQQPLLQAALHRAGAADEHCPAKTASQHPVQQAIVRKTASTAH